MRFLILNHHVKEFAGSEINTLQLCQAFLALGHTVEIGTFHYDSPMRALVEKAGIRVIDLLQEGAAGLQYDAIWAHHAPVLSQLVFNQPISDARILFSSLGPLEPLEAPPIFHDAIPLFLVNSRGNQRRLIQNGVREDKIRYFPNFAPERFFRPAKVQMPARPAKIAVVSNHPPGEVIEFARQADSSGCHVDLIGINQQRVFVDDDVLSGYDLVITIGKTVQYCFALRIPIYCYDWFGGPGYLTRANLAQAEDTNFSGRGFDRHLTAEEIFQDIFDRYGSACSELDFLQAECRSRMCLETNLRALVQVIETLPVTRISDLRQDQTLAERVYAIYIREFKIRFQISEYNRTLGEQNSWLKSEMDRLQQAVDAQLPHIQDQAARVELLTTQLGEKARANETLSQALAENKQVNDALSLALAEKEQAYNTASLALAEKERVLGEISLALAEKERILADVSQGLADRERELRDVQLSRGWQMILWQRRAQAGVRSWFRRIFRQ
jgi:hypothetical protein